MTTSTSTTNAPHLTLREACASTEPEVASDGGVVVGSGEPHRSSLYEA